MSFVELLKVLVLGIVEGFTEWLPISSTGHMILVDELIHLNVTKEFKDVFLVVIQLGAILAVVMLYFQKLNPFTKVRGTCVEKSRLMFGKSFGVPMKTYALQTPRGEMEETVFPLWGHVALKAETVVLWLKVVVACIPAALVGIPLDDWMEEHLRSSFIVAAALILYGILFIGIENRNFGKRPVTEGVEDITFRLALYIGLFQVLSLVPGTSRSGSTILGAMVLGCSRTAGSEFSFFLGIPVMLGASLLKLVKFGFHYTGTEIFILLFGMAVAFLVSVYSIRFLMSYIRKNDFKLFGYYRIVLGVIVVLYFGVQAFL